MLVIAEAMCCHDDGGDGRHVCSKYHGHTHYYQATMLVLDYCCMKWTNQIASLEVTIRDSYLARGNY